jgi:glucokinase
VKAAIGVDVGGTKCLAVAVEPSGTVIAEHRVGTPGTGEELIEVVSGAVDAVTAQAGPPAAVGIGVPGLVGLDGVLHFVPHRPYITELDLGRRLGERFGDVPLRIDNDATCAAWAEATIGAAAGCRNVLLATLGTGIGGGLVIDGVLARGANGFAGEIGHVIVDPSGPPCPCGQRGCWERYASGSGLGWLAREAAVAGRASALVELAGGDPEAVRGEHVTGAARQGDPGALAVMAGFAWWLALGLANLANIVDPERIVLGGGMAEAGEILLAPTRQAFERLVEGVRHRPQIPIVTARLGGRAGAVGAALLARGS